jgi:tricorn protease
MKFILISFISLISVLLPAAAQTKLLRFPDIAGDSIVFCYGGDLWKVSTEGGLANRLTAHQGQELFPKFSPCGQWIAFTGQYDGDEQVYVMPAVGGVPKQLTYYPATGPLPPRWGYDHQVYGWTPDGEQVLFRSLRDADGGRNLTALYTVPVTGGLATMLPMPTSGAGDFSPDGTKLIYSPLFRDFRTWKRYEGGWAQDLYVFDIATNTATPINNSKRTERDPMWIGDTIYFASDRDDTLNLFAYDPASKATEQLTSSSTWDVRWPSTDNTSQIVYELNGELAIYNVTSKETKSLTITVPNDGLALRSSRYPAHKNIEGYGLSPKGERAVFVARGDVFTVPIEKGSPRNLTNSSDAHDRHATWSPNGRQIAFISDHSGEDQVCLISQDGSGEIESLTTSHKAMLYQPEWSPDGKRLAYADKDGKLFVLTLESKTTLEIIEAPRAGIRGHTWSPHGGHLAFALQERNGLSSLHIWSVADGQVKQITDEMFDEFNPAWDPEGNYLYYLATREFAPQISNIEWNYATSRGTSIYALPLRKDVPHPFAPESDEATVEEPTEKKNKDAEDEKKKEEVTDESEAIIIDFEDLAGRAVRFPIEADNIDRLSANKGHVLYTSHGPSFYGRSSGRKSTVHIFDIKKRKAHDLVNDSNNYAVSSDGSKVLANQGGAYHLYDAKPAAKDKKTISTNKLMVDRVPSEEWHTVFDEVWRRYRDFFYVSNLHGYDWKAIGEQYRPLVAHVAHRSDLNYVIGEMIAELNVGHAYIAGGDYDTPDRPQVALPGARFELDTDSKRYRLAKIFTGHNEEPKYRSPLTESGVDVTEGDYVLAIDGEELLGSDNPYRLLQHKSDAVTLTVSATAEHEGARQVTYQPINSESSLLYLGWVLGNLEKVSAMTAGKVGYLHIPDMGAPGIYEFIKWFYPQIRKEAMVIDVRSNGGGNVSQWIIERLDTKLLGTRFGYSSDEPGTYPAVVFHGHKVCLINETSASDGDIFPYRFRAAGLGPLIGKRSWGGVVGISSRGPLLDGGTVYVPLQATNGPDGAYIIEGHGVDPDIEVENLPQDVLADRDPQLERGVQEILQMMAENPMSLPSRPADPIKTKQNP